MLHLLIPTYQAVMHAASLLHLSMQATWSAAVCVSQAAMAPGSFLASRVESMGEVGAAATMVAAKMAKTEENCMMIVESGSVLVL